MILLSQTPSFQALTNNIIPDGLSQTASFQTGFLHEQRAPFFTGTGSEEPSIEGSFQSSCSVMEAEDGGVA